MPFPVRRSLFLVLAIYEQHKKTDDVICFAEFYLCASASLFPGSRFLSQLNI